MKKSVYAIMVSEKSSIQSSVKYICLFGFFYFRLVFFYRRRGKVKIYVSWEGFLRGFLVLEFFFGFDLLDGWLLLGDWVLIFVNFSRQYRDVAACSRFFFFMFFYSSQDVLFLCQLYKQVYFDFLSYFIDLNIFVKVIYKYG